MKVLPSSARSETNGRESEPRVRRWAHARLGGRVEAEGDGVSARAAKKGRRGQYHEGTALLCPFGDERAREGASRAPLGAREAKWSCRGTIELEINVGLTHLSPLPRLRQPSLRTTHPTPRAALLQRVCPLVGPSPRRRGQCPTLRRRPRGNSSPSSGHRWLSSWRRIGGEGEVGCEGADRRGEAER